MIQSIYLIRHGQREDFENPGWKTTAARPYDTPLSATGFRQARDVGYTLKSADIGLLFASPFLRALQTADAIASALNLPIRVEMGFCEWLNPAWQDTAPVLPTTLEAHRQFARVDLNYHSIGSARFPEIDERIQVMARVRTTLTAIIGHHPEQNIAIVAHGSPLGQICGLLIPHVSGVHMQVGSITRIDREASSYRLIHSGIEHLKDQHQEVRFN